MMRIRISDSMKRKFVWRYLNSSKARGYFQRHATGTSGNMPKINRKTLMSLPISLPPDDIMRQICDNIDYHTKVVDCIERVCQTPRSSWIARKSLSALRLWLEDWFLAVPRRVR